MKHAAFVRSPHAHAAIKGIDTSKAASMPGVIGVLTGDELANDGIGSLICGWMIHSKDGSPMNMGDWRPLAQAKVRYVGDRGGVVVADTKARRATPPRSRQGRLRGTAGGHRGRRRAEGRARRRSTTTRRAISSTTGRSATGRRRRRDRQRRPCHQHGHRQQPPGAQRDGAARRARPLRHRPRTTTRCGRPRRTRMWRAW
jgi:hypothetical protein